MRKKYLLLLALLVLALSLVVAGCGSKADTDPGVPQSKTETGQVKYKAKDLERNSQEGEVTITATLANPLGEGKEGYLTFITVLNTHSVDLASFPLDKYAQLFNTGGELLSSEAQWETVSGEGHHLVGKLHFSRNGLDLEQLEGIKLVIENYGGKAKRELTWEKKYLSL